MGGRHEVGLDIGVDRGAEEQEDDQGAHDDADDPQAGQPLLVVPADGLEHGPETMVQVEPDGDEPYDVQRQDPPVAEGCQKQVVRILRLAAHEFAELHLGPEMGEMESQEAQDDDSEDGHVLGGPGVVLRLGRDLVTLHAATLLDVLIAEPASVDDVDKETQGQDRDHDVDERSTHEVAADLEPAVAGGETDRVLGHFAEFPVQGVDHGEEIDGSVQDQEDDEERAGDALDELLADGRGEEISHIGYVVSLVW